MHALALLALVAAYNTNNPNVYQLVTFAGGCQGCHATASVPAPTVTATQVTADPLVAGGSAQFSITVQSNRATPAGNFAAFAAGVPGNPGDVSADSPAKACGKDGEPTCPNGLAGVRDVTKEPFGTDGTFTWTFTIANLKAGHFTMNIGGNDVNGNNLSTGDHSLPATLTFDVSEGEGEGAAGGEGEGAAGGEGEGAAGEGEGAGGEGEGEGEGTTPPPAGCSSTSTSTSVPFAALALVGVGAAAIARRRVTRRT